MAFPATNRDSVARYQKLCGISLLHVRIHGDGGVDGIEVGGYVTPLVEAKMILG